MARGGRRQGAGRPKGSKNPPRKPLVLPSALVEVRRDLSVELRDPSVKRRFKELAAVETAERGWLWLEQAAELALAQGDLRSLIYVRELQLKHGQGVPVPKEAPPPFEIAALIKKVSEAIPPPAAPPPAEAFMRLIPPALPPAPLDAAIAAWEQKQEAHSEAQTAAMRAVPLAVVRARRTWRRDEVHDTPSDPPVADPLATRTTVGTLKVQALVEDRYAPLVPAPDDPPGEDESTQANVTRQDRAKWKADGILIQAPIPDPDHPGLNKLAWFWRPQSVTAVGPWTLGDVL